MAVGPGTYWFYDESITQIGTVKMDAQGNWEWIPRSGKGNRGKWGSPAPGHITYFQNSDNKTVCKNMPMGECFYDGAAPWNGLNLVTMGSMAPK